MALTAEEYRDRVVPEILREATDLECFDFVSEKGIEGFVEVYDEFIIHTSLRDFLFAIVESYFKDYKDFIDSAEVKLNELKGGGQYLLGYAWAGWGGGAKIREHNGFIPQARDLHFNDTGRNSLNQLIDLFLDYTELAMRERYLSYTAVEAWYGTRDFHGKGTYYIPIISDLFGKYGEFSVEDPELSKDDFLEVVKSTTGWDIKESPSYKLLEICYNQILKTDKEWIVKERLYYDSAVAMVVIRDDAGSLQWGKDLTDSPGKLFIE